MMPSNVEHVAECAYKPGHKVPTPIAYKDPWSTIPGNDFIIQHSCNMFCILLL